MQSAADCCDMAATAESCCNPSSRTWYRSSGGMGAAGCHSDLYRAPYTKTAGRRPWLTAGSTRWHPRGLGYGPLAAMACCFISTFIWADRRNLFCKGCIRNPLCGSFLWRRRCVDFGNLLLSSSTEKKDSALKFTSGPFKSRGQNFSMQGNICWMHLIKRNHLQQGISNWVILSQVGQHWIQKAANSDRTGNTCPGSLNGATPGVFLLIQLNAFKRFCGTNHLILISRRPRESFFICHPDKES